MRFLVLILLIALPGLAQADAAADALVAKMVQRDHELVQHRARYTYTVTETRDKLDHDGKVTDSSTDTEQIRGDQAPSYHTRDGPGMEGDLKQAAHEEPFNILQIVSHFDFAIVGSEPWNGVPCTKVKFTPKPDQPYHSREEKVANALAGYLWIAQADDSLLHNTGRLTHPVPVAWFFASVEDLDFLFDTKRLPNGEFGPSEIRYSFLVSVPFLEIHERHTRLMTNYR